jgi:hypothetical protein
MGPELTAAGENVAGFGDKGREILLLRFLRGDCGMTALICVLFLFHPVPGGQQAPMPAAARVSGRVLIRGLPAPGIDVVLTSDGAPASSPHLGGPAARPLTTRTDSNGSYSFDGLAPGSYGVKVFAPRFLVDGRDSFRSPPKVVNIKEVDGTAAVDFDLSMGAAITGRITDPEGQPVVGERVSIGMVRENGPVFYQYDPDRSRYETDDQGIYRVYGLEPGRYLISAGGYLVGSSRRFFTALYYPGVADQSKASVVDLAEGAEVGGVDIRLVESPPCYSVTGSVIAADSGKPVAGIQFSLHRFSGIRNAPPSSGIVNTSNNAGEFHLENLAIGNYALGLLPEKDVEFYSEGVGFKVVDRDLTGVVLKLHRGASISGVAEVEGSTDGAVRQKLARLKLTVSAVGTGNQGGMTFYPIAEDGSFRITGLRPGKVRISLTGGGIAGGFSLVRVERDGADQSAGIDLGPGEQVSGVRLVLAHGTGSIRGWVRIEGRSLQDGEQVWISPRSVRTGEDSRRWVADANGGFIIEDLPDGDYELTFGIASQKRTVNLPVKRTITIAGGSRTEVSVVLNLNQK